MAEAPRYHKFRWTLSSGDPGHEWGDSSWYYEFAPDGYVRRQVTLYDAGVRVRYSHDRLSDEYGGLDGDVSRDEMVLSAGQEIGAGEFEEVWRPGPWTNEQAEPGAAVDRGRKAGPGH